MRSSVFILILWLTACSPPAAPAPDSGGGNNGAERSGSPPETPLRPASSKPAPASGEWSLDDGQLRYKATGEEQPALVMECRQGQLAVRLPAVTPIESEERLSIGGGGDVETLVADVRAKRPAVEARGPAPDRVRLLDFLTAGPGASYGATAIGPLAPVPRSLAEAFTGDCR